ncbi:MAG: hypothetical protein ACP5MH_11240, partial [Thermoproteus sp.]
SKTSHGPLQMYIPLRKTRWSPATIPPDPTLQAGLNAATVRAASPWALELRRLAGVQRRST